MKRVDIRSNRHRSLDPSRSKEKLEDEDDEEKGEGTSVAEGLEEEKCLSSLLLPSLLRIIAPN